MEALAGSTVDIAATRAELLAVEHLHVASEAGSLRRDAHNNDKVARANATLILPLEALEELGCLLWDGWGWGKVGRKLVSAKLKTE